MAHIASVSFGLSLKPTPRAWLATLLTLAHEDHVEDGDAADLVAG